MSNLDKNELFNKLFGSNNHYDFKPAKYVTASQELKEFNIIKEFNGLKKLLQQEDVPRKNYKQARYNILLYIINSVKYDHINGDYYDKDNNQLVIDAGHLLYNFDGMRGMDDELVWSFIPKRYHNDINYLWNGIGEWIA
jgi:hypothetical protein